MDNFKPKDQIAYIPLHAEGDIKHPDVEFGFVTSISKSGDVFVRYWSKFTPGELRTKANSECTPIGMLVHHKSVSDRLIDNVWDWYVEVNYE